jgi:cytochrome c peroxidase
MSNGRIARSQTAKRLLALALICVFLQGQAAWGKVVVPPAGMIPLNQVAVPQPPNLAQYVKSTFAAVRLGKAFFWDMQVGSDGVTACATCHFHAGVDTRVKNTLNPGTNAGVPDSIFGNVSSVLNALPGISGFPQFGPNYELQPTDFPLHQRAEPVELQSSAIIRDTNDVVGSQGVRLSQFDDIVAGSDVDLTTPINDPVFKLSPGHNVRQVTGRQAPSMINAVFNFSNFWDGRAHFIFNGETPFGPLDQSAGVWFEVGGQLVKQQVAIENASLASQAVGPPLSDVEMSARGRTFPQIGKKLLDPGLVPLGKQLVHPGDSVLGPLSKATRLPDGTVADVKGLSTNYRQMIQDAFVENLWESNLVTPEGYTQMELNFSLFWGLAIQMYESTLVSDQTRFDQYLSGDILALTDSELRGFEVFIGIGNCVVCHAGPELTNNSFTTIAFVNNIDNGAIELMFTADGNQVIYDNGMNNTGVTPTADDLGRGATHTNPNTAQTFPLSFSRLAQLQALDPLFPFSTIQLPVLLPGPEPVPIPADFPVNANGLFKVPGLRNVELTAPYFHNGSSGTLEQVVDFYVRGGNFSLNNLADLDPIILSGIPQIEDNPARQSDLVAFMKALTDQRVVRESAPFDHPELFIPAGDPEVLTKIAARDATGSPTSGSNDPPSITSAAITSASMGQLYTYAVTATDPNLDTLTYSLVTAPTGMTIDAATGVINWIPGLLGPNTISLRVTDPAGLTASQSFLLTVNGPPTISSTPVTSTVGGQIYTYDVNATDAGGSVMTYSLDLAPGGMTIDSATGAITWIPTGSQVGPVVNNVVVRATASTGLSSTQTFNISVADKVTVSKAIHKVKGKMWKISGKSLPPPQQQRIITVYRGPKVGGKVLGTATVGANGSWSFKQLNSAVPPVKNANKQKISVQSSYGGKLENVPIQVRP